MVMSVAQLKAALQLGEGGVTLWFLLWWVFKDIFRRDTDFICNAAKVIFEENLQRNLFITNCSSPVVFDCLRPLSTCYNAAAEAVAPPLQQREWGRCSSSLLLVLLLCAVLQADAVLGSRSCTDSVLEACTSRRPGAASPGISREQYSVAAWDVPSAEILNIQAKRRGLMQGWEIIKRSALCCLCLSLSQYF